MDPLNAHLKGEEGPESRRHGLRHLYPLLVVLVLVINAAGLQFWLERKARRAVIADRELTTVKLRRFELTRELHSTATRMLALSRNQALLAATSGASAAYRSQLSRNFATVGRDGDRVFLLNRRGLLRLSAEIQGGAARFDSQQASRGVSKGALTLPAGFWQRKVQVWHPVQNESEEINLGWLRLGAPLFDENGRQQGALLLDWRSSRAHAESGDDPRELSMHFCQLDGDKLVECYLISDPSGFERVANSDHPLSAAQWRQVSTEDSGQFHGEFGLISFDTLVPTQFIAELALVRKELEAENVNWKLLTLLPSGALNAELNAFPLHLLYIYVPIFVLLYLGALLLTWANSRRQIAEEALRNAEQARRELLASVNDVVFSFEVVVQNIAASPLRQINPAGTLLLGYEKEDLENRTIKDLITPTDFPFLQEAVRQLLANKVPNPRELGMKSKSGSQMALMSMPRLIDDSSPPVVQIWARDVSELKKATAKQEIAEKAFALQSSVVEALEEQEPLSGRLGKVLDLLVEYSDLGIQGKAAIYRLKEDDKSQELIAYRGDGFESLAETDAELELPEGELCSEAIITGGLQFTQHDHPLPGELTNNDKAGAEQGQCAVPLKTAGKVNGILMLAIPSDPIWIQERHDSIEKVGSRLGNTLAREETIDALSAQAEVLKSKLSHTEEKLATSSKFVSEFSQTISDPVEKIIEHVDRIPAKGLGDEHGQSLEAVKLSSGKLLKTINNVLDLSRIESEEFKLNSCIFDPTASVQEVFDSFVWMAEEKGLVLKIDVETGLPTQLAGDQKRFQQILINLLSNAFKFTTDGEIVLKVELAKREDDAVLLHCVVRDTGSGIPEEKQQEIYKVLASSESTLTDLSDETGMGLALSTYLVRAMGGRIWLQSTAGQGSSFHFMSRFTLPSETEPQDAVKSPEQSQERPDAIQPGGDQESMHILVADEDETRLGELTQMLLERGDRVRAVSRGLEVIESMAQYEFDLMFLSVSLQDVDGLTTTNAIREFESASGGHIPIFIMTPEENPEDEEVFSGAGADGHLVTPIYSHELYELIAVQSRDARKGTSESVYRTHSGKDDSMREDSLDVSVFDKNAALDRMGGDLDLLIELAGMFLRDCPRLVEGLQEALENNDSDSVHKLAHSLKGAVGNFSAHSAYDAANELETMGRDKDLSGAKEVFSDLKQNIERLKPALAKL